MALVIEDGSGKPDANSYVTATEAREYATARGVTLSDADNVVEAFLVKAADYIETFDSQFVGERATDEQALSWPRAEVCLNGKEWPTERIHPNILKAQMQAVIEQHNGMDLMPTSDGTVVKRKKVDVLEKEFFSAQELGMTGAPAPTFPRIEALLEPLLGNRGAWLSTVRV